jgi:integration host factor subunit alpha
MPSSRTLTKAKIIDLVSESNGYTRKNSVDTVETVLELIKRSLKSGEDVLISGFGKFRVKQKAERKGRNPATGTDMMLEPSRVVTFQCSGMLREKVNRKKAAPKKSRTKKIKIAFVSLQFLRGGFNGQEKGTKTSESVNQTGIFNRNSRPGLDDSITCLQSDN